MPSLCCNAAPAAAGYELVEPIDVYRMQAVTPDIHKVGAVAPDLYKLDAVTPQPALRLCLLIHSDIQIFRCSGIQIFRYSDIQIFRYSDIQTMPELQAWMVLR